MLKKVYFTKHADDPYFVERAHALLDGSWLLLGNPEMGRDIERLCGLTVLHVGEPMFAQAAAIVGQEKNPKEGMRLVGMELLTLAVFVETLRRWPDTHLLQVEYLEEHAFLVDKQLRYYELTNHRALFFALLHESLGDLCLQSEVKALDDRGRAYVLPAAAGQAFSLMDFLVPLYRALEKATSKEPDFSNRMQICSRHLLHGAETAFLLAKHQIG